MGRRLHSRLDMFYPDLSEKVQTQQLKQKLDHDTSKALRSFAVGDLVYTQNFSATPPKWIPGEVVEVTGPLSYKVKLEAGTIARRHVDHLRQRSSPVAVETQPPTVDPLTLPDIPPDPAPPAPPAPPPTLPRQQPQKSWHLRPRTSKPNYRGH